MNGLTEFILKCEGLSTSALLEIRRGLVCIRRDLILQLGNSHPATIEFAVKESLRSVDDKIQVADAMLSERTTFKHLRLVK